MSYVSRRALAKFLDVETSSQAKADRRGKGPGGAVHVSKTHVVYPLENVLRFCAARGLEWDPRKAKAPAGTGAEEGQERVNDTPNSRPQA